MLPPSGIAGRSEPRLKRFKVANKAKCAGDPLSEDIEYVAATKSHFVHALKLCSEGAHHFQNQPHNPKIRFRSDDKEGKEMQTEGVLAVIHEKEVW